MKSPFSTCGLSTDGSLTFDTLTTPEMGVIHSFNTNGLGGNVYGSGLPKGLHKLSIRYWNQKDWCSIYPTTHQPQGSVLAYQ